MAKKTVKPKNGGRAGAYRVMLLAVLLCFGVGAANANTISYEQAIALQAISWGPLALSLNQFNPSLGTLTGIEIQLTSTSNATLTVRNNSATQTENFSRATARIALVLNGPGGLTVTSTATTGQQSGSVAPLGQVDIPGLTGTGSASTVISSSFTPYIGTGFVGTMSASSGLSSAGGSGGRDLRYSANGSVGGTAKIIYTYTVASVPEPAAMILIGSGLLGLAFVAKRRRFV